MKPKPPLNLPSGCQACWGLSLFLRRFLREEEEEEREEGDRKHGGGFPEWRLQTVAGLCCLGSGNHAKLFVMDDFRHPSRQPTGSAIFLDPFKGYSVECLAHGSPGRLGTIQAPGLLVSAEKGPQRLLLGSCSS